MAYYILEPRYALRGWEGLPFAVIDGLTNRADFYTKDKFMLVARCDGMSDIDLDALGEEQRLFLDSLVEKEIIRPCEGPRALMPRQSYHTYPARYKQSAHWSITGRCNFRCRRTWTTCRSTLRTARRWT